jgi:hypothetical protein
MDRKKTGTQPHRTVLGPDHWSRLHPFLSCHGPSPYSRNKIWQLPTNRLKPVDNGDCLDFSMKTEYQKLSYITTKGS